MDYLLVCLFLYTQGEAPNQSACPGQAGISVKGATGICIFEGSMDADQYIQILQRTLLPFLSDVMPNSHRFMQDNDPKHCSRKAQ